METIRLAALDMDGTLLNHRHEISEGTREAIRLASEAGCLVALCTGRTMSEVWAPIQGVKGLHYAVCENGACLYDLDARRAIRRNPIPDATVEKMIEIARTRDLLVQFFMNDQSHARIARDGDLARFGLAHFRKVLEEGSVFDPEMFEHWTVSREPVDKMMMYACGTEAQLELEHRLLEEDVTVARSLAWGLEVTGPGVNKAAGLRMLCEILHVDMESVMAVGDNDNDLDMLRAVGMPVAMGNAIPEIRDAARWVTEDNDHDGVAGALRRAVMARR